VELHLRDYRDERGSYDGVASIEMFEAVGERWWPAYFATLMRALRPGRRAALQVITLAEARWEAYRGGVDFIQKHVFPGGMLPSPERLRGCAARAGLRDEGSLEFGDSYSATLRLWLGAFEARWAEVGALGFDERFRRLWTFYLAGCAAAFRAGRCDVTQIALGRPA
jgi:cyclopropane-fatty-acyl-phospholipid synthase